MSEIARYEPATPAVQTGAPVALYRDPATDALDGWIAVMADVARLSEYIADTELVPLDVRRRPAAVAAIILTGREMGIPPMTSLRHVHIVKGKPGVSAELMRAQVEARGHEIEFLEMTDTRCVVRGRRKGQSEWLTVSFTADQARKAKIDLGGYPEDKLVARATSRLCRRRFADCIAGIASVDELEDGIAPGLPIAASPDGLPASGEAAPPTRTAQRRTRATKATAEASPPRVSAAPAAAAPETPAPGPPLPGEEGFDAPNDEPPPEDTAPGPADDDPVPRAMNNAMHALFGEAEVTDRDERLRLTNHLLNEHFTTSKDMRVRHARALLDALNALKASGHPAGLPGAVNDVLNLAALKDAEDEVADAAGETDLPLDGGES